MTMMRWPAKDKKPDQPDTSELLEALSEPILRWLAIRHASEEEVDMILGHAIVSDDHTAEKHAQFLELMDLRALGPLHREAEAVYRRARFRASLHVARLAWRAPLVADNAIEVDHRVPVGEWFKARWIAADEAVRQSLRRLADSLSIDVPLTRTRRAGPKDSSSSARSVPDLQPSLGESGPEILPAEAESEERDDGPQWHDADADGWIPCESLYDALHPDEERGWY